MIYILRKEFNSFLNSLIAYVVMGVFLTAMGLLMWVFPDTSVMDYGYADMYALFSLGPYVFIFLIPAITMRSFSEEKKGRTMELLLTKPITDMQLVVGKYLASFLLVLVTLAPTIIYYFSIVALGNPPGNIDSPAVVGSYIGLALLGAVFCAIGVFSSSLTSNQIVSFILAAFLCFLLFTGFESLAQLNVWSANVLFIRQLGLQYHYESLSRGLVDSRDVVFFVSVITVMLLLTRVAIGSRSW